MSTHACRPSRNKVSATEVRRMFFRVIQAVEDAGVRIGKDSDVHVIMLAFCAGKLRRTRGSSDSGMTARLIDAANEARASLGLPADVLGRLLEAGE